VGIVIIADIFVGITKKSVKGFVELDTHRQDIDVRLNIWIEVRTQQEVKFWVEHKEVEHARVQTQTIKETLVAYHLSY
jgi:hypothetical protein